MESPRRQDTSFSINTPTDTDSQYKLDSGIHVQSPLPLSYIKDEKDGANDHIPTLLVDRRASYDSYVAVGGRPTPVRKYSEEWWKRSWDSAIQHRIWPRVVYATIFMIVIGAWLGGMMGFAADEQKWGNGQQDQMKARVKERKSGGFYAEIGLKGALKRFDPVTRSLSVEWSGFYNDTAANTTMPLASNSTSRWPFYIYRDISTALHNYGNSSVPGYPSSNLTSSENSTIPSYFETYYADADDFSYVDSQYVLRTDNATATHIGVIGAHLWDTVDTEISFGPKDEKPNAFRQPLFAYPFDEWSGSITFVAVDSYYEKYLNGSKGVGIMSLYAAYLAENTLNWRFDLDYQSICAINELYGNLTDPDITSSFLPPDNSRPIGLADGTEGLFPCQLEVTIFGRRPPLVKFAAVMAVIVNWTSTFFIFVLTCETLIMRRGYMLSGTDLLGITFTALFALPSVRLLLPGAPDFGILIDLVGIIPNVIIISLCITAIAITKLNRHKKTAEKEHDD